MKRLFCFFIAVTFVFGSMLTAMAQGDEQGSTNYYSIVFNENNIPNDFSTMLYSNGVELVYAVPEIGFAQVKGDKSTLGKLLNLSSVKTANPAIAWSIPEVKKVKAENYLDVNTEYVPLWDLQWDIKKITQNGASYELGTGSHDVVVGIIDTGVDRDHPDLVKNILPGSKNFVPAGGFQNMEPYETGNPDDFDDKTGHGSHLAGSIAANGMMLGVAPNTGIRAYRVFGKSSAESAWIFAGIVSAANDGVDVISMSFSAFDILGQIFYIDPVTGEKIALGNNVADFVAYKRAIQYAQDKGVFIVTSAGNEALNVTNKKDVTNFLNEQYSQNGYKFVGAGFVVPATLPGVVTVSATGPNDEVALYSNYGPGYIDVAAPGGDISLYMEYLQQGKIDEYFAQNLYINEFCLSTGNAGDYAFEVGTSMAAPKVAAVAALIIDKYGKMEPQKLAQMIHNKAVDTVNGKDKKYFGYGYLNAVNALMD